MKKLDSHYMNLSVKSAAKKIRAQHTAAMLGFLGNSLGVLAVADRHDAGHDKQRIIPFSNAQPGAYLRACSDRDGEHGFDLSDMYRIHHQNIHARFEAIYGETDISPKNLIASGEKLVVIDRVWDGKSLAAFGFFWNELAKKQDCQDAAADHIAFCAVNKKNDQDEWKSFTIIDWRNDKTVLYKAGVTVVPELDTRSCSEIFNIDDYDQIGRLSPRLDLCSAEKIDGAQKAKAVAAILEYYRGYAADVTGRMPDVATATVKTAGLLIG